MTRSAMMLLVLAASLLAAPVSAQEVDPGEVVGGLAFRDQVQVTVVNLDVFVRDDDGRPVTGLTRNDFRVLQDGLPQPLSHFAAFTEEVIQRVVEDRPGAPPTADTQEAGAVGMEAEPAAEAPAFADLQPVHLVLFVDNENIVPTDRTRVLRQVRSFIDKVMYPHVQVMVLSAERSLKMLQPFTNDPKLVRDALRSMGKLSGARTSRDSQRGEILREMQRMVDQPRTQRDEAIHAQYDLEGRVRVFGEESVMELDSSLGMVRETTFMLAGLPGRKILVHVSSGLPMVAGKDLIHQYGDLFQRGSTLPMLTRFDRRRSYRTLAAAANAQGITFYTIDATGLGGNPGVSAEYSRPVDPMVTAIYVNNMQEPLMYLAERTGGRAILDANDVTDGLMELRNDLFTYYSLGYTISAAGGDVVHEVEVEIPAHRDYEVVYRRTFVEKSRATEVQDTVATGLIFDVDDNPMGIRLRTDDPSPATEDRWMTPIQVEVPLESVALVPGVEGYVGQLVMFVATRDADGRQSDVQRREFTIEVPEADLETAAGRHYTFEVSLLMREGRHRVSVGMLDRVTRQAAYATVPATVP